MHQFLRHLKLAVLLILGGLAVPALLSIIFSGFQINMVSIVSFQFFVGLIPALIGGILIVYDFATFRKRVMKTPIDMELDEEKKEELKIDWPHVLFFSGIIVVVIAYTLGEIL